MKRFLRDILIIYSVLQIYALFISNSMMFLPPEPGYDSGPEIVRIPRGAGHIAAIYLKNPQARYTILYSHGNAEDIGWLRPHLQLYVERGFAVLAYDYSGYGLSDGSPGERASYADISVAYAYLVNELQTPPERIILLGRSIGSGPSLYLAEREPVAGVILESAFTAAFRTMTRWPIFIFDRYPNIRRIADIGCPVLIMHGQQDGEIPIRHSIKLLAAAHEPKRHLWVKGAGHDDLVYRAGAAYWSALSSFAELCGD